MSAVTTHLRLPGILLFVLLAVCLLTALDPPAGRLNWFLEVGPGLAGVAVLFAFRRRFPMSHWVYWCVFFHMLILIYGGYYTYAETPLGNWFRDAFHLARNHYDRVGHVALGVFPAFITREVLIRATPLRRGGWLYFLVVSVVLAVAAFWELLEWWIALMVAPDVGQSFLAMQGDPWDTQWDMFLALAGAMVVLPLFARLHDRSMEKVPPTPASQRSAAPDADTRPPEFG